VLSLDALIPGARTGGEPLAPGTRGASAKRPHLLRLGDFLQPVTQQDE